MNKRKMDFALSNKTTRKRPNMKEKKTGKSAVREEFGRK
ncbi:hypothetical protein DOT_6123 [Desulfosporosinus sp. OT]|nr:hypothetical protein DOT_6123 [Desulfosporosinus sp. OT]